MEYRGLIALGYQDDKGWATFASSERNRLVADEPINISQRYSVDSRIIDEPVGR